MNIYETLPMGWLAGLAISLGLTLSVAGGVLYMMGPRSMYSSNRSTKVMATLAGGYYVTGACLALSAGGLNAAVSINQNFNTEHVIVHPFYMITCCVALLALTVALVMTRSMGFVTIMGFTALLAFTLTVVTAMMFVSYPSDELALAVNGATALTGIALLVFIGSLLRKRNSHSRRRSEQHLRY